MARWTDDLGWKPTSADGRSCLYSGGMNLTRRGLLGTYDSMEWRYRTVPLPRWAGDLGVLDRRMGCVTFGFLFSPLVSIFFTVILEGLGKFQVPAVHVAQSFKSMVQKGKATWLLAMTDDDTNTLGGERR